MTKPVLKKYLILIILVLCIIFLGWNVYSGQSGVIQKVKNATTPFDDSIVDAVPAEAGRLIRVKEPYQGGLFWSESRKDKIERFQCSRCHNNKTVTVNQAAKIAHGDITLAHGGKEGPLACYTCHKEAERDYLLTKKGEKVDMDHSYQMCGQCHFRQKKDWIGGAHGKRVGYWAGDRIVKNCTSCHDPHSPRFKKRWPDTYSLPLDK